MKWLHRWNQVQGRKQETGIQLSRDEGNISDLVKNDRELETDRMSLRSKWEMSLCLLFVLLSLSSSSLLSLILNVRKPTFIANINPNFILSHFLIRIIFPSFKFLVTQEEGRRRRGSQMYEEKSRSKRRKFLSMTCSIFLSWICAWSSLDTLLSPIFSLFFSLLSFFSLLFIFFLSPFSSSQTSFRSMLKRFFIHTLNGFSLSLSFLRLRSWSCAAAWTAFSLLFSCCLSWTSLESVFLQSQRGLDAVFRASIFLKSCYNSFLSTLVSQKFSLQRETSRFDLFFHQPHFLR